MNRTSLVALAFLVTLAAAPGRADVIVRAPFVTVQVASAVTGGGVYVRAPFVRLHVPRARRATIVGPAALEPAPRMAPRAARNGEGPPPSPEAAQVAAKPLALTDFASRFKAAPGSYEVMLVHPVTGAAVPVRFTLPEGTPQRIRVLPRQLVFDYDGHWVRVRFRGDGSVRVRWQ